MFGMSFAELMMIFIVILVVLGPKRLPQVAGALGKAIREFRRATHEITQSLEIDEIRNTFKESVNYKGTIPTKRELEGALKNKTKEYLGLEGNLEANLGLQQKPQALIKTTKTEDFKPVSAAKVGLEVEDSKALPEPDPYTESEHPYYENSDSLDKEAEVEEDEDQKSEEEEYLEDRAGLDQIETDRQEWWTAGLDGERFLSFSREKLTVHPRMKRQPVRRIKLKPSRVVEKLERVPMPVRANSDETDLIELIIEENHA